MIAEQLPLPRFRPPEKSPVAVVLSIKDVESDPKILMARRPNGRWTFPGGKLRWYERKRPARGARRELWEETGILTYAEDDLIESYLSPVRVAVDGREKNIHVFYCFSDEAASTDIPIHREPKKNGPWKYIPIRRLPYMIADGRLHKLASMVDLNIIVSEAADVVQGVAEEMQRENERLKYVPDFREERLGFLGYIHERDAQRFELSNSD